MMNSLEFASCSGIETVFHLILLDAALAAVIVLIYNIETKLKSSDSDGSESHSLSVLGYATKLLAKP